MLIANYTLQIDGPIVDNFKELVEGTAIVFSLNATEVRPWPGGVVFSLNTLEDDGKTFTHRCNRVIAMLSGDALKKSSHIERSAISPILNASKVPCVFISYTWDTPEHVSWVENLASRLRNDGVNVLLDKWAVPFGHDLAAFMDQGVTKSDFVLVVCTPNYKLKAEGRTGGAGYEGAVITGQILAGVAVEKFVPVLRCGEWKQSGPARLLVSRYVDCRKDPLDENEYAELLDTLFDRRRVLAIGQPKKKSGRRKIVGVKKKPSRGADNLAKVLSETSSRLIPLAKCVADTFAASDKHSPLKQFCERELQGIPNATEFLDKRAADFPHHRVFQMFIAWGQAINPAFFGWGNNPENVFSYMESRSDDFQKINTIARESISRLEANAAKASSTALKSWKRSARDFVPETAAPDAPVFCYARSDTDAGIVEATRGELTRLLIATMAK